MFLNLSSKQLNPLNIFWFGFIIYTLGYVASKTGHVNLSICKLIEIIGLVLFLPTGIFLTKFRIKNGYLRIVFILYCLWLLSVISRGIHFDYVSLNLMLSDANYGIFIYFAPFLLLFPNDFSFYRKIFDVIIILGIFFLIYDIVFVRELLDRSGETQDFIEHFSKSLSIPCAFILLTYKYHSNKRNLLALGIIVFSLLFSIYKGRRGLSSIILVFSMASYFLYLFNTRRKLLVIYLSFLFVILGVFYYSNLYHVKKNGLLGLIAERGNDDTRTIVELFFYGDMKNKDIIMGKGINGEYFCPDCEEDQVTNYRSYIETGYLQIILKGGIIMLGLYLLIAVPAVILGLLYSKNSLAKASGIWILISLISLYPATVNTFSLAFLLVWVSIGICYNKKLRNLSDNDIKKFLHDSPHTNRNNIILNSK